MCEIIILDQFCQIFHEMCLRLLSTDNFVKYFTKCSPGNLFGNNPRPILSNISQNVHQIIYSGISL